MTRILYPYARSKAAIIAGSGLLFMAILAAAANFGVIQPNSNTLAAYAASNPFTFGMALLSLMLVVVLDVLVAWAFNMLFRDVLPALSLLTAWFRIIYAAVFLVAIAILSTLPGLAGTDLAALPFGLFSAIWDAGLLLFGVHLLLLGVLLIRAPFTPGWLGVLVSIAGAGYLTDTVIQLLALNSAFSVGTFTFIGEVVLFIWLLVRFRSLPPVEPHQPAAG